MFKFVDRLLKGKKITGASIPGIPVQKLSPLNRTSFVAFIATS